MITMGYENYALKNPIKTWRYESSNLSNMATESTLDCGSINNYWLKLSIESTQICQSVHNMHGYLK